MGLIYTRSASTATARDTAKLVSREFSDGSSSGDTFRKFPGKFLQPLLEFRHNGYPFTAKITGIIMHLIAKYRYKLQDLNIDFAHQN